MPQLLSGASAFLEQAHRNNWQRYLASLPSGDGGALRNEPVRGWDLCLLTAGDEAQAELYRRQLRWRKVAGFLPAGTEFVVLGDPGGHRIGSGGATLQALQAIAHRQAASAQGSWPHRVLVLHSGGNAHSLPHTALIGRLFAHVPRTLPDGRASTLFDEFLISLSGLATAAPPGVLIAAGDVLLIFDHLQASLQRPGVTGMATGAPVEMAQQHGVYVAEPGTTHVRAYLHKPAATDLRRWDAVDRDGVVQLDTGLVWLDADAAAAFLSLADAPGVAGAALNLYGDLLLPLTASAPGSAYLSDAAPIARRAIWDRLHGMSFNVERLHPAAFAYFGAAREYWQMVASDPALAQLCGWTASAASWQATSSGGPDEMSHCVAINALLEGQLDGCDAPVLVVDSTLSGPVSWCGAALVAHVQTAAPIALGADVVVEQAPLRGGPVVTFLYGLDDQPMLSAEDPAATFLNRSWGAWLAAMGVAAEEIWPGMLAAERTLWNARLFPILLDPEAGLRLTLCMQQPTEAPEAWLLAWRATERLSLGEVRQRGDGARLLRHMAQVEAQIIAHAFMDSIQAEQPVAQIAWPRRSRNAPTQQVTARLAASDPITRFRGYAALTETTGEAQWETRAFAELAQMVAGSVLPARTLTPAHGLMAGARADAPSMLRATAAARIDFGGGWTDTPPRSIERGGTVLNAAVTLRGAHPVIAEAAWLPVPRLALESVELGASYEPVCVGDLLAYANPADPFSLHKAALVLCGLAPRDLDPATPIATLLAPLDRGLRLSTQTMIPRGSGLGTSSIMAGVVLTALHGLIDGMPVPTQAALFDEVLCLEQMMTTGGGWQDQVGGLTGGIKLVTAPPGLPPRLTVEPVLLAPVTRQALDQQLLLVYTGQQRLAKNLLRQVMRRWMLREPEMVWILDEIARLALAMQDALASGDLAAFGVLLSNHWSLNKRMHPGCTNPFIDDLFDVMTPFIFGGKLAGAGGGGFAMVVARDAEAAVDLRAVLATRYPGTPVSIWPCAIPDAGLVVSILTADEAAG